jgi:rhodanese-related sulfurtransferase
MPLNISRVIFLTVWTVLFLLMPSQVSAGLFNPSWKTTYAKIQNDFPRAKQIDAAVFLNTYKNKDYRLLDIRNSSEYRFSHLQGAVNAADTKTALDKLKGVNKRTPIIVYCSVGYRSSAAAVDLQKAGFTHVRNIKGGIFTWVNEGRPVFQNDVRVIKVHPYNRYWSALLHSDYAAKLP